MVVSDRNENRRRCRELPSRLRRRGGPCGRIIRTAEATLELTLVRCCVPHLIFPVHSLPERARLGEWLQDVSCDVRTLGGCGMPRTYGANQKGCYSSGTMLMPTSAPTLSGGRRTGCSARNGKTANTWHRLGSSGSQTILPDPSPR